MADYTEIEAAKLNKYHPNLKKLGFGTAFRLVQTTLTTAVSNIATETAKVLALKSGVADVATHNYAGAHADWTLSTAEKLCPIVIATNADTAANAIFGTAAVCTGKWIIFTNGTSYTITAKPSNASGVAIPTGETAILYGNGSDLVRVNAVTPTVTSAITNLQSGIESIATHDYAGGAVDWTLSAAERLCTQIVVTNANGAINAIWGTAAGLAGKSIWVRNASGQALTCKPSDASGIVVANGKSACLYSNGSDWLRRTADQTH